MSSVNSNLSDYFWGLCTAISHTGPSLGSRKSGESMVCYARCLCEVVWQILPNLWAAKNWQHHHGNALLLLSTVHVVKVFLVKHNMPLVCQVSFSPDLAPFDLAVAEAQQYTQGRIFKSKEDIKQNLTAYLYSIPEKWFQKCFQLQQKCW